MSFLFHFVGSLFFSWRNGLPFCNSTWWSHHVRGQWVETWMLYWCFFLSLTNCNLLLKKKRPQKHLITRNHKISCRLQSIHHSFWWNKNWDPDVPNAAVNLWWPENLHFKSGPSWDTFVKKKSRAIQHEVSIASGYQKQIYRKGFGDDFLQEFVLLCTCRNVLRSLFAFIFVFCF